MTEHTENLILEHLRAMRSDIGVIKDTIRDLTRRVSNLETHVAQIIKRLANVEAEVLCNDARFDRIDERLGRIERRLELVP